MNKNFIHRGLLLHYEKSQRNDNAGGGVVVDGVGVGVFPFVVEASKHTAVNK